MTRVQDYGVTINDQQIDIDQVSVANSNSHNSIISNSNSNQTKVMKEYIGKLFDKITAIDITDYSQSVLQSPTDFVNQKLR